jgi:predicted PurR-regulated permease PerM
MNDISQPKSVQRWSARQVVAATLVVVAVALAFYLLYQFQLILFSLFAAVIISTALRPLVDRMAGRGVSRTASAGILFLLIVLVLVLVILLLVPTISEQGAQIGSTLGGFYSNLRVSLAQSPSLFIRRIGFQLPQTVAPPEVEPGGETIIAEQFAPVMDALDVFLQGSLALVAVLLLTFYWTLEGPLAIRSMLQLVPPANRETVRDFVQRAEDRLGRYVRGLAILSLSIFVLSLIVYVLIGLPQALILAIFAGILEAIPVVGPVLGAVPAGLIALTLEPSKVIWVVVATVIIQQIESVFLVPRVMRGAVGVNPFVTLLSLTAFGSLFGIGGALLAIPLAMILQMALQQFVFDVSSAAEEPADRDKISRLRYEAQELIQDVHKQIRHKDVDSDGQADHVEDSIEAITGDLVEILTDVDEDDDPAQKERAL